MKNETTPTTRQRTMRQPKHWFASLGSIASYAVALLLVAYVITTLLGFTSLESPDDPIEDPYFTLMEVLILLIMPLMLLAIVAFHEWAPPAKKIYVLSALGFLAITVGITSSVHFVVWTVGHTISEQVENAEYLFSFSWPSVAYALDILAWDWFFGLCMILGAFVVNWTCRVEKALRVLMLLSGILSLVGLIAIPLDNMQIRIIGIVGYAVATIPIFILLGLLLRCDAATAEYSVVIKDDSIKEPYAQEIQPELEQCCEVSSE